MTGTRRDAIKRLNESIERLEAPITHAELVAAFVAGQEHRRNHPPHDPEFMKRPSARELLDTLRAGTEADQRAREAEQLRRWA